MLLGKPGRKPDTLIDQFFKAGGIFEDALGKHGIFFFDMAVGKIF